jgi:GNAT superfamily N-acetyltransferase
MEYKIKHLKTSDYDQLIRLWKRAGLPYRPSGRDSVRAMAEEFSRAETCILGMYNDDRLIGSVIGTSDGRKGWINRLAIDPEYRGQGLAGILITSAENFLQGFGIQVMATLIEEENLPSISSFKKAGYIYSPGICYFSKRSSVDD